MSVDEALVELNQNKPHGANLGLSNNKGYTQDSENEVTERERARYIEMYAI